MADPVDRTARPTESAPPGAPALPFIRRLSYWGFVGLVALAGVFYVSWGFAYGIWLDNGVYAVAITLALFGLAGMWLVSPNPPAATAEPP
ncbi:MAG TPA: hypothetical protein VGV64_05070 [Thermoplasmata archaeon]|nr:hypothetical protein [Thermoplasmata archaeon]